MDIISIIKGWLERHLLPEKGLFYIGGSDTLPPPLDKADEEKAIIAMENGDECAKNCLRNIICALSSIYPDGLKIRALTSRISFP